MKSSFVTAKVGISIGVGIGLSLGLLGLTYASRQASSSTVQESLSQVSERSAAQEDVLLEFDSTLPQQPDSFITYDADSVQPSPPVLEQQVPEPSSLLGKTTDPLRVSSQVASASPKQVNPVVPAVSASTSLVVGASIVPHQAIEQTITQHISDLATCPYAQGEAAGEIVAVDEHRYTYHPVDLNGDRQDEFIVQILGPMTCGTGGCTTLVLQESSEPDQATYEVVTQMSVVKFPIIVSDRTSSGWSDLLVSVSGGGAQPGYRQLKFDGQSYPTNPSMEAMAAVSETTPNGKVLSVNEDVEAIAPALSMTDCES